MKRLVIAFVLALSASTASAFGTIEVTSEGTIVSGFPGIRNAVVSREFNATMDVGTAVTTFADGGAADGGAADGGAADGGAADGGAADGGAADGGAADGGA